MFSHKNIIKSEELVTYNMPVHNALTGEKKATAPGIPRRSPIQVLTRPDIA